MFSAPLALFAMAIHALAAAFTGLEGESSPVRNAFFGELQGQGRPIFLGPAFIADFRTGPDWKGIVASVCPRVTVPTPATAATRRHLCVTFRIRQLRFHNF